MIDFNKYRQMSPYYDLSGSPKLKRDITREQALMEFDFYQKYMPNTHEIYVNDSTTPILGTMVDVTDLEALSDSKWVLTSLKNKIYCGDVVKFDGQTWLCIYDKLKNVKSCNKVKIQPCKISINLPFYEFDKDGKLTTIPTVRTYPVLTNVYITDMQNSSGYMDKDADNLGVTLTYDKYTALLDKEFRIYLFGKAWEITGINYTDIDFMELDENGNARGALKLMIKVSKLESADNISKQVCDYNKYFDTPTVVIIQGNQSVYISSKYDYIIENLNNNTVNWTLTDTNDNATNLATIISQSNTGCKIQCGSKEGTIKLSTVCTENNSLQDSIQIKIKNLL
jgi:hypothetical protein